MWVWVWVWAELRSQAEVPAQVAARIPAQDTAQVSRSRPSSDPRLRFEGQEPLQLRGEFLLTLFFYVINII